MISKRKRSSATRSSLSGHWLEALGRPQRSTEGEESGCEVLKEQSEDEEVASNQEGLGIAATTTPLVTTPASRYHPAFECNHKTATHSATSRPLATTQAPRNEANKENDSTVLSCHRYTCSKPHMTSYEANQEPGKALFTAVSASCYLPSSSTRKPFLSDVTGNEASTKNEGTAHHTVSSHPPTSSKKPPSGAKLKHVNIQPELGSALYDTPKQPQLTKTNPQESARAEPQNVVKDSTQDIARANTQDLHYAKTQRASTQDLATADFARANTKDLAARATTQDLAGGSTQDLARASIQDLARANTQDLARANTQDLVRANTQDLVKANTQDFARASTQDLARSSTQDLATASTQDFARADLTRAITQDLVRANTQDRTQDLTKTNTKDLARGNTTNFSANTQSKAPTQEPSFTQEHPKASLEARPRGQETTDGKAVVPGKPPDQHRVPPIHGQLPVLGGMGIVVMKSANYHRKFRKLELSGEGGSSKVFKVQGEDLQIYALKEVYLKNLNDVVKKAYYNEIILLKRLRDKPEIITLYDYTFDKQECILHLLLEYGEMDLMTALRTQRKTMLNFMAAVLYYWNQMLQIVKVIHDEKIIHNDLKPENFVCIGPALRLIDFGIANKIEMDHTSIERDICCGTVNYMAPETIDTHEDHDYYKVGKPSDVWSLGCILYQMVYGKTPFGHIKNRIKKSMAIVNSSEEIKFPDIPQKSAIDIMKRCLTRNPKQRPTVVELLQHPFSTVS